MLSHDTDECILSSSREHEQSKMALPLFVNCNDLLTCPVKNHLINGIILTVIYGVIVFLILTAFPDKTDVKSKTATATNTPSKKRTKTPVCPDAPRSKRQRINNSAIFSNSIARELFPEDKTEKICPNAPIKQKRRTNLVRTKSLSTIRELFAEDNITGTPNAPIKQKATKNVNSELIGSLANKLNFADDQIAGLKATDVITNPIDISDIRTRPDNHEQLTSETSVICSFYKPGNTIQEITNTLSNDADTIDFTNPDRKKPDVNKTAIINYLLTLNRMVKNLQMLNRSAIALPHAGTGETTTRTDKQYFLVDKLMNATVNADVMNRQLSAILLNDYNRLKYTWTTIPKTYVQVCQLCREVAIMSRLLHKELSDNMNLTPWSEW